MSHQLTEAVARMWTERGGRLLRDVETNMVWLDLREAGIGVQEFNQAGAKHKIRLDGKRVVLHHQVCEDAMLRLQRTMDDVLRRRASLTTKAPVSGGETLRARL